MRLRPVAVLIFAASLCLGGQAGWYASGGTWSNRKAITIDHSKVAGTSVLVNFPVLVSLRDDDLRTVANGGLVANAWGSDILFTGADGTTKLAHEMESYDAKAGTLVAWVAVPQLSPVTDTALYVYFGNAGASRYNNGDALTSVCRLP